MKKIVINEKEYTPVPFDFNTVCDLEDAGFSLEEFDGKQMKAMRAYFALCAGMTADRAGKEINEHILNGGNLGALAEIMGEELQKSDFFRALQKGAKEETAENPEEENQKAEEAE